MSYRKYPQHDPRRPTAKALRHIYELIVELRKDAQDCDDPKAKALLTAGAEVLAGLARAYRSYEDEVTNAERRL